MSNLLFMRLTVTRPKSHHFLVSKLQDGNLHEIITNATNRST